MSEDRPYAIVSFATSGETLWKLTSLAYKFHVPRSRLIRVILETALQNWDENFYKDLLARKYSQGKSQ